MVIQRIKPRRSSSPTEQDLLDNLQLHEMAFDLDTGTVWFRVDTSGTFSTDFQKVNADTVEGLNADEIIQAAKGGSPNETFQGALLNYKASNKISRDTIHYARVFLRRSKTYTQGGVFSVEGGVSGNAVFGIYDDSGSNGLPGNRVATTGVQSVTSPAAGRLHISFSSGVSVSSNSFYWLAWNMDLDPSVLTTTTEINIPGNLQSNGVAFHKFVTEARTTTNGLPSTASATVSKFRPPFLSVINS